MGTLLVNLVGSFLIALILGLALRGAAIPPNLRLFLTTGVLGGFTTYSSFNWEALHLLENGDLSDAFAYLAFTLVGCFGAGLLGVASARVVARVA